MRRPAPAQPTRADKPDPTQKLRLNRRPAWQRRPTLDIFLSVMSRRHIENALWAGAGYHNLRWTGLLAQVLRGYGSFQA
jgi:hypothetical protein